MSTTILNRVAHVARNTAAAAVIGGAALSGITGAAVGLAGPANATSAIDAQFVDAIHHAGINVEAQSAITVGKSVCGYLGQGVTAERIRAELINDNDMSEATATTFVVYAVQAYCPQYITETPSTQSPDSQVPYRIPENETTNTQSAGSPTSAGMYGDPDAAAHYWRHQKYDDCALMAVASVVGELTGDLPTEQEIIERAATIPSKVDPSQPVYRRGSGTADPDIVQLLAAYQITGYLTYESTENQTGVPTGLAELKQYLAQGHKILVGVDSDTLWGGGGDGDRTKADHQVVVTGIDAANGMVHLNDSGNPNGRNMRVPTDTFMQAWSLDDYSTIVTQEAA